MIDRRANADVTGGAIAKPGLAASAAPALTIAASLLGLGLFWALAASAWPSRAFPTPAAVWGVLVSEAANGDGVAVSASSTRILRAAMSVISPASVGTS